MRAGYSTRVPNSGTSKVCQSRDDGLACNPACPLSTRSKELKMLGIRESARIHHPNGHLQGNPVGQMLFLAGLMRGVFFSAVWRSMRRNWLEMRESRTKKLSGYDVVRVLSSHRAQRPPGSLAGRPVG